jgi:WhiB family transcriptional regulator, redox-sensing transcriptional regulator
MSATVAPRRTSIEDYIPACVGDPERWTTTDPDDGAKALCRQCPRRWLCAWQAWHTPGAQGLWAGVVIPESGRARDFARRRLRSLAELGGYPVRPRRRRRAADNCGQSH